MSHSFAEAVGRIDYEVAKAMALDEAAQQAWADVGESARRLRTEIAFESELQKIAWNARIGAYEAALHRGRP